MAITTRNEVVTAINSFQTGVFRNISAEKLRDYCNIVLDYVDDKIEVYESHMDFPESGDPRLIFIREDEENGFQPTLYYWNQTELINLNSGGSTSNLLTVNNKTANYTLVASDSGKYLTFDSTSNLDLTVPTGLPIGFHVTISQLGTGKVDIVESGTVVRNSQGYARTRTQFSVIEILSHNTNAFIAKGDLGPADATLVGASGSFYNA